VTPPPGPVSKKLKLEMTVSPDAVNIKKALSQQFQPKVKALKGLRVLFVLFFELTLMVDRQS
jgi:hypothetical protein